MPTFAARPFLGGFANTDSSSGRTFSSSSRPPSDAEAGPSSSGAAAAPGADTGGGAAVRLGPGLTNQQQEALASLVLSSFRHDPTAAAGVLSRSLDDAGRRELLSVLGATLRPEPPMSRGAMVSADAADDPLPPQPLAAAAAPAAPPPAPPSLRQLTWVAVSKGIPFFAFGFCDNAIMITAGEQIDLMFGARLGLSSMAAAGLGNAVADVVGINISHSIEQRTKGSKRLASGLTAAQASMPSTRRAKWLGCAVGMAAGCLAGLVPLLFIDTEAHHQQAVTQQPGQEQQPAGVGG